MMSLCCAISSQFRWQRRPLLCACQSGHKDVAKLLIQSGAQVNVKNFSGNTPLQYAALHGYHELTAILLKQGAKVDEIDDTGRTALHLSSSEGHLNTVKILVRHLLPNTKANQMSSTANRVAHQKLLTFVNVRDYDHRTALLDACEKGHFDVAKFLVEYAADVSIPDFSGRNPLHVACGEGYFAIVQLLLSNGANVRTADYNYRYPIHWAAKHGNVDIVNTLIDAGANVNVLDAVSDTPLHLASDGGHLQVNTSLCLLAFVELFQNCRCVILFSTSVESCKFSQRKRLFRQIYVARPFCDSSEKKLRQKPKCPTFSFCDISLFLEMQTSVLLLRHGAEVQCVGMQGRTPLHEACRRGHFFLASLLLQHGADIHAQDEYNRTALSLAIDGNIHHPHLQNDLKDFVNLENQTTSTPPLTSLCRKAIRRSLGGVGVKNKTEMLPVPAPIKEYLLYCDMPLWQLSKPEEDRH